MNGHRLHVKTSAWLACLAICAGLAVEASAQLTPEVSAEIAGYNKYLWRGAVLTDGWVIQPSATVGCGGLEFGIWSNMDQDDVNGRQHDFNEIDYTASFTQGLGLVGFTAGAVHYSYPDGNFAATTELFVGGSASVLASPSLTVYRDIDEGDGTYVSLGASRTLPVGASALDLSVALGWGNRKHNAYSYGADLGGLADAGVTLSMDIGLSRFLKLRPTLGYTTLLTTELRDATAEPDNFLFGMVLSGGL